MLESDFIQEKVMFRFVTKIKKALAKTRSAITQKIVSLFQGTWDEETFEKLEQVLYEADLGSECAVFLVERTRNYLKKNKEASIDDILDFLRQESIEMLSVEPKVVPSVPQANHPKVILVVGVNGSGKTTSIAKLAAALKKSGESVLLAAGDTFRAAAIEQLATWADRLNLPIIKSSPGSDPAAVAYDAVEAAQARGVDTVIIDTAGRLQNKTDLMRELEKIVRVIKKVIPEGPHETLLVLDATTGQNAVDQTEVFNQFTPLTGIVLSKLDGSAKGGIVLSIYRKFGIPVKWIGLGEGKEDFESFDKNGYVEALFKP